jgi:hypothetical protein
MFISCIRKLFFFSIVIVFTLSVKAQQPHFIYLQTDNGQPFYTKFNGKLISSSSEGYVVLSGVTDGDYQLIVGFPKNQHPEEIFRISVNKNNEGFLIKNFDEKGLQLFNLQTLALIEGTGNNTIASSVKKDNDPFSVALAGAVKDSSILQNHDNIVATPVKKADEPNAINVDTSKAINNVAAGSSAVPPLLNPLASKENSSVTKILDKKDKEGTQMIYADKDSSGTDTINVLMPIVKNRKDSNEEKNIASQKNSSVADSSQLTTIPAVISSETKAKKDSLENNQTGKTDITIDKNSEDVTKSGKVVPVEKSDKRISEAANSTSESPADSSIKKPSKNTVIILPQEVNSSRTNSDCKDFATDNDFLKLRGKMAEESENDKMIRLAKKYFQKKCYSTAQIKNLSYIFLTNEGKYDFFEAAYPFVSDSGQYPALETQFTDSYYLTRFKALVSK